MKPSILLHPVFKSCIHCQEPHLPCVPALLKLKETKFYSCPRTKPSPYLLTVINSFNVTQNNFMHLLTAVCLFVSQFLFTAHVSSPLIGPALHPSAVSKKHPQKTQPSWMWPQIIIFPLPTQPSLAFYWRQNVKTADGSAARTCISISSVELDACHWLRRNTVMHLRLSKRREMISLKSTSMQCFPQYFIMFVSW